METFFVTHEGIKIPCLRNYKIIKPYTKLQRFVAPVDVTVKTSTMVADVVMPKAEPPKKGKEKGKGKGKGALKPPPAKKPRVS